LCACLAWREKQKQLQTEVRQLQQHQHNELLSQVPDIHTAAQSLHVVDEEIDNWTQRFEKGDFSFITTHSKCTNSLLRKRLNISLFKESEIQATQALSNISTIIYTSRTHSQLTQVIKELKSTEYK
jgi:hypothetical protein